MSDKTENNEFLTYKGKPLVRCGDTLYYGSMHDKYVCKLDVKSKKEVNGLQVADRVAVALMCTQIDPTGKTILKTGERPGLYLALDIADAWLTKALAEE